MKQDLTIEQLGKIKVLLNELYLENDFYRNLFIEKDIDPGNVDCEHFLQLPVITKDVIRKNEGDYYSRSDEAYYVEYTTGSTGVPLRCLKTKREKLISTLAIWQERRRWDPEVNIENYVSLFGRDDTSFNPFDFSEQNMIYSFNELLSLNPRWLSAPITALLRYAKLINECIIKYDKKQIKFIELIGEYAEQSEREIVEHAFGCKTILHYGLRETWFACYECPEGNLHVREDLFFLEQDNSNKQIQEGMNEILITSFFNKKMPIIRYSTGDLGKVERMHCKCGQHTQVLKLAGGRKAGIIKGPNEMLGDMFFKRIIRSLIEDGDDSIETFRVEQNSIDQFTFFIVPNDQFNDSVKSKLVKRVNEKIKRKVTVNIITVKTIPVLTSGKFQVFKCLC
ncbi:hypothetical protein [Paenibacillus tundrae]